MRDLLCFIACLVILLALLIGAYTDWKTRTIPNSVNLTILLMGFFTAGDLVNKFVELFFLALVLFIAQKITHTKSGGGDIKLYLALTFSLGMFSLGVLLVVMLFCYTAFRLLKHIGKAERFPVCTFMAVAYIMYLPFILPPIHLL